MSTVGHKLKISGSSLSVSKSFTKESSKKSVIWLLVWQFHRHLDASYSLNWCNKWYSTSLIVELKQVHSLSLLL